MASKLAYLLKRRHATVSDPQLPPQGSKVRRTTGPAAGAASRQQNGRAHPAVSQRQPVDDVEDASDDGGVAYEALLGLMARSKGSAGAAIKQRRLEEQGHSDADSDSDSESSSQSDAEEASTSHDLHEGQDVPVDSDDDNDDDSGSSGSEGDAERRRNPPLAGSPLKDNDSPPIKRAPEAAAAGDQGPSGTHLADSAAAAAVASSTSHWDQHISHTLTDAEAEALKSCSNSKWTPLVQTTTTPGGASIPSSSSRRAASHNASQQQQQDASTQQAPVGAVFGPYAAGWQGVGWEVAGRPGLPPAPARLAAAGVKDRVRARWLELHQDASSSTQLQQGTDFLSPQQQAMFGLCDAYCDVLNATKPYQDAPGVDPLLDVVLLHCANHCAKMANAVKANNERLKAAGADGASDVSVIPRDQGFVRAKVLLLLPMRNMAYAVVRRLVALVGKETRVDSVQGKEKFVEQFAGDTDEEDFDAAAGKRKGRAKPPDYRALFSGNTDDHFRMGIRITRGQVKLFSDLVNSDIIVASPLALATRIAEDAAAAARGGGAEGGGWKAAGGGKGKGPGDFKAQAEKGKGPGGGTAASAGTESDFLSSVEVVVVERADVMLMQNWQHVVTVFEHLNKLPKAAHGTDIMRVREAFLRGIAACYRQTLISASFAAPQFNALLGRHCCCWEGKVRLTALPTGVLGQVVPQVRQLFERFTPPSPDKLPETRFEFFRTSIWPRLQEAGSSSGLLLVVPDYLDYLRLRKFLTSESADFATLCEYTPQGAATRARALFAQRRVPLLLYTERAHFYHRWNIRGVQDVVFYGVPLHGNYYAELLNLMEGAAAGTVTVMFSAYDKLALSRVVGASRADKMVASESPTFMFC